MLKKGIAYHIGYLPSGIRLRIEDFYKKGIIKTIFCTSTLIEGVNLPADNLFITDYKNGRSNLTQVDFKNLIGRVGRIEFNLYGNVFLVRMSEKTKSEKYIELLTMEIPDQQLSVQTELTKPQRELIVRSLINGQVELDRYPAKQSADEYALMRKFAIILLKDILSGNASSVVKKAFSDVLTDKIEGQIVAAFATKKMDDDINISVDQVDNLVSAISKGLTYPAIDNSTVDYPELLNFLERLSRIFKWKVYEKSTLGHISKKTGQLGKLKWYAVILAQWVQGNGLSAIMKAAIEYKQNNPDTGIEVDGKVIPFDDSKKHRNVVISTTLNAIEDVILFRLANYFLRFSIEYKKHHNLTSMNNDWYEYVEYGTTNPLTIMLQRNGFSREASTYIKSHREYLVSIDGEYKLKSALLECTNKNVQYEAREVKYNVPELYLS